MHWTPNLGAYRDGHEFNSLIGNFANDQVTRFNSTDTSGVLKTYAERVHDRRVNAWLKGDSHSYDVSTAQLVTDLLNNDSGKTMKSPSGMPKKE